MSQAPSNVVHSGPNHPINPASQRHPSIGSNQKVIRKDDGSVVIQETTVNGNLSEVRVDSVKDTDMLAKGIRPWYLDYLEDEAEQEKEDPVAKPNSETPKAQPKTAPRSAAETKAETKKSEAKPAAKKGKS